MKKAILSFLLALIICLPLSTSAIGAEVPKINIDIDGKPLTMDVAPIEQNGRVLVPFRAIAESLGVIVSWDEATSTVTAVKGDKTIKLVIDSNIAVVDGKEITLDVPAIIINDRTLVPIRFMAENSGSDVQWDEVNLKVVIKTAASIQIPETPVDPSVPVPSTPSGPSSPSVPSNNSEANQKLDSIISKYEGELNSLRDSNMSQINDIITKASTEFHSLPKEQQTLEKKISIVTNYLPQAELIDNSLTAQVNTKLDEMKSELESNGLSTASVDQAKQEFDTQKQAKMVELYKKAGI